MVQLAPLRLLIVAEIRLQIPLAEIPYVHLQVDIGAHVQVEFVVVEPVTLVQLLQ